MPATSSFRWFDAVERKFTLAAPVQAHAFAANVAAGISARAVRSKGTGQLARDISRVKPGGLLVSYIGSALPQTRIQNFGGTIRAKNAKYLAIHGNRRGASGQATRSSYRGPIVALKKEVTLPGKHFLDAGAAAFPGLFVSALKRFMP